MDQGRESAEAASELLDAVGVTLGFSPYFRDRNSRDSRLSPDWGAHLPGAPQTPANFFFQVSFPLCKLQERTGKSWGALGVWDNDLLPAMWGGGGVIINSPVAVSHPLSAFLPQYELKNP